MKEIKFEEGSKLEKIGDRAFSGCTSLINIELLKCENLHTISKKAFNGCGSLETLNIPKSVEYLGYELFGDSGYYKVKNGEYEYYKLKKLFLKKVRN